MKTDPTLEEARAALDFRTLRAANTARQAEWDSDNQITLAYRGNELAGEVGEACNVLKKIERERLGIRGSRATLDDLASELADVIICADLIAMHEGIDLGEAVRTKFNATSEKVGLATRLPAAREEIRSAGGGEREHANPPAACCADCGRAYREAAGFADLVIPDEAWHRIAPREGGGGLLCPSCMVARAAINGMENVPARFMSGPFCVSAPAPERADDTAIEAIMRSAFGSDWRTDARALIACQDVSSLIDRICAGHDAAVRRVLEARDATIADLEKRLAEAELSAANWEEASRANIGSVKDATTNKIERERDEARATIADHVRRIADLEASLSSAVRVVEEGRRLFSTYGLLANTKDLSAGAWACSCDDFLRNVALLSPVEDGESG